MVPVELFRFCARPLKPSMTTRHPKRISRRTRDTSAKLGQHSPTPTQPPASSTATVTNEAATAVTTPRWPWNSGGVPGPRDTMSPTSGGSRGTTRGVAMTCAAGSLSASGRTSCSDDRSSSWLKDFRRSGLRWKLPRLRVGASSAPHGPLASAWLGGAFSGSVHWPLLRERPAKQPSLRMPCSRFVQQLSHWPMFEETLGRGT
mmetsp:Transcript_64419/g.203637  ORF Transcript_64419/g.203637 Transcript_64419/m.203637 type:complete len:203 (+) Transcript_64419:479-1087(+)